MLFPASKYSSSLDFMKRKTSILVGICSAQGYEERRNTLRDTWLKHPQEGIECLFFLGGEVPAGEEEDCISLPAPDTYNELPQKILEFFKYALEHYDFDWLFKCDDDTYIALDRLKLLPNHKYSLIGDISLKNRLAPSGGAGYMLSRDLVEKIVAVPDIPQTGSEDLIYGKIALELGAAPLATEKLCMHNTRYPSPDNDTVTSHWCSPDQIRAIDIIYREEPDAICLGEHPYWTDDIYFYKKGIFRRKTSGCTGKWHLADNGALSLEWFTWDKEQLIFIGNQYVGSSLCIIPPAPRFVPNALVEMHLPPPENPVTTPPLYLHLGCGGNQIKGWFNMDMPNFDITKPLPFPKNSVDALFLEHVIEHVSPAEAVQFFDNARHVLKPGGILRLAFPDLLRISQQTTQEYVDFVQNAGWGDGSPGSEIRSIIVNHGHKTIWTAETMMITLRSVGFSVTQVNQGESTFPHMRGLEQHGSQIGKIINFIETSCVEAIN